MEIFDGKSENDALIGNLCESPESRNIFSSSNFMTIKFAPLEYDKYEGFSAKYLAVHVDSSK
jgi:hypothetical protein